MKKGVSILSLAIAIIVMSILTGIVVISMNNSIGETEIKIFALELFNIQTAANEYYYEKGNYPVGASVTLNLANVPSSSLTQFSGETKTGNTISLKKINFSLIGIKGNKYGNNETTTDMYALSEATGRVYYLDGVENNEDTYYTLTDSLYTALEINNNLDNNVSSKDIKKYDVIFTPSSTTHTNQPIIVQVKVPKEATINSVTTTESKSVGAQNVSGVYKIVTVNETSADKNGNYKIVVDYTYNNVRKQAEYEVTTFDNTAPELATDVIVENGIRTIKLKATDNLSGIKTIKYAESKIANNSYFDYYGKAVIGGEIRLTEASEYTIYVQDKAGNYFMLSGE